MLSSNEKISFINEYMNAYKEKIKMANKYGLFDAAKMFELFAIEVCRLWFRLDFTNLNKEKATYPFVDLISGDMQLFVQVTTADDLPRKIKTTLEKIRDTKDERFSVLNKVIFFVLTNDSVEKVQDYNGDEQIGRVSFTKNDNLITTKDIINKAENDNTFLNDLYEVLNLEFERFKKCGEELNEAIQFSRSVGLKNITGLINMEYEIDRSILVKKIKDDNERFVTILGSAGSGKSALCKKIVQNVTTILYARAESFMEATDINEIWKCNVKKILEYLNGKKNVFFIDALEFIADRSDTKFELLQYLYETVSKYKNAYILTSCRTSDKSAFIRLESNFTIKLCWDYARQNNRESQIAVAACTIMEYFIENAKNSAKHYKFIDVVKPCLEAVYLMVDASIEWIKGFWESLIDDYKSSDGRKRMAKDAMEWTLQNAYPDLVKEMTKEICLLADEFWLGNKKESKDYVFYSNRMNDDGEYGLSENAEHYDSSYRNVYQNVFLWNLFRINFKEGFQWAIQFVNKTMTEYSANNPNDTIKIKLLFVDNHAEREYLGNGSMWMAGIMENSVPVLIGDIIFCLRDEIIRCLEDFKQNNELMVAFANYIKRTLYSDSNNIALLSIVEAIGFHFEWDLPGYSLDLITSMRLFIGMYQDICYM